MNINCPSGKSKIGVFFTIVDVITISISTVLPVAFVCVIAGVLITVLLVKWRRQVDFFFCSAYLTDIAVEKREK